ncbi:MAG: acyloxyacyl hydrolase [Phycisphaerales bacterium]|nr:acyloxyacyl hydrolase [Phycisphaerales bacterium]
MTHRLAACILLALPPVALAQESDGSLSFRLVTQPESQAPPAEPAPIPPARLAFGTEGTQWLTFGAAVGRGFRESTDTNIHAAWSRFVADDIEFAAELDLWNFDQDGPNAYGISPAMVFRWHVITEGKWTFYTDAGIGLLIASDSVPDGGSNIDFMPRAGGGVTYGITGDTRLQFGLRWHHVSNARITGDESNPARDGPLIYFGIIHRF